MQGGIWAPLVAWPSLLHATGRVASGPPWLRDPHFCTRLGKWHLGPVGCVTLTFARDWESGIWAPLVAWPSHLHPTGKVASGPPWLRDPDLCKLLGKWHLGPLGCVTLIFARDWESGIWASLVVWPSHLHPTGKVASGPHWLREPHFCTRLGKWHLGPVGCVTLTFARDWESGIWAHLVAW